MSARTIAAYVGWGALSLVWSVASLACKGSPDEPAAAASAAATAPALVAAPAAPALSAVDPCAALCARSRELRCSGVEACEATCARLRDSDPCGVEMRAALSCFVAQPATSWECGDDGMAAIREGLCVAAQQSVVNCLSASAAH